MKDSKCDSQITIRLPSDVVDALKVKAKSARRKLGDYARIVLLEAAERQLKEDADGAA